MGIAISSILETDGQAAPNDTTSLGVSVGDGMIHYALVTCDEAGRTVVESRVFDVDPGDGLDAVGRVNAGIDLMLDAARAAGHRVGPIGIAARTASGRRRLRSGGTGTRRQVHLCSDDEAVATLLAATGQIDRFDSVLIVDIGDTGMSMYLVDPRRGVLGQHERSTVISGQRVDEALAERVADRSLGAEEQTRRGRAALISACRTAKEEAGAPVAGADGFSLSGETIAAALEPQVTQAREVVRSYLARITASSHTAPEAIVLVGGLANIAAVAEGIAAEGIAAEGIAAGDDSAEAGVGEDLEIIVAPNPELAAATGAALVAATNTHVGRLAFIGGRRARKWFAAPLAVGVASVAGIAMAAVAVAATLSDSPTVGPTTTSEQSTEIPVVRDSGYTTTAAHSSVLTRSSDPAAEPTLPDQPQYPGWATTELAQPTTWTSTLTLSPNVPGQSVPSEPSTPSQAPSSSPRWTLPLPSDLLPPGLLPTTIPPQTNAPQITVPSLVPVPSTETTPPAQVPDSTAPDAPIETTTTTTPAG